MPNTKPTHLLLLLLPPRLLLLLLLCNIMGWFADHVPLTIV